jgi:general secretion pathway protein D
VAAALRVLDDALAKDPTDPALRAAQVRAREQASAPGDADRRPARVAGRWDEAQALLSQLAQADARHPRLTALSTEIERAAARRQLPPAAPR